MVVPKPEFAKSRYQSLTRLVPSGSGLEDGDDALAAGGADRDQPPLARARLVQLLGELGDDAAAGGGERVSGRQRRAVDVELGPVDRAQRGGQPELGLAEVSVLPGLQRGEHRGGEGLVDLVE